MRWYDAYLRRLYRGGRPNWWARVQNRASAKVFAAGAVPRRAAALGVRGRRSGQVIWFPVALTEVGGERYIVSMLGRDVNWVRNLAAAKGRATLRHGRQENVRLVEVDPAVRGPILREFLRGAPGARAHVPIRLDAPAAEYQRVAVDYPTFRIDRIDPEGSPTGL